MPLFLYPVGVISLLLAIALILHRHPRWMKGLVISALVILLVSSNRVVSTSLVRSLEWQYFPPNPIPTADVIVVLGGGTDSAQPPRSMVEVNGAGDRVLYALALYKKGIAPHLLLSGGTIDWLESRSSTPASEMADLLQLMGVPAEALWLQPRSQNTAEDATFSAQMIHEKFPNSPAPRVLLVTSAAHMPRSVLLFRQAGIEVIPAPTDYSVTEASWNELFRPDFQGQLVGLLPSAGNISAVTNVLKEYIGITVARLRPIKLP
jgi:uncharacterized SAM-binding protein YcdF (DUF218 family)